ncbi:MAG: hypothetical protein EPO07_01690 [Verrucomicrobia bacterium]|nr:MAG: hypothetical protein EPO07_01690 [Verrucomicrobiota bacterium]
MDKTKLTNVFNQGFRRGANDRAASGSPLAGERQSPSQIPSLPAECVSHSEQTAWTEGYTMGYQVGASDVELASVDVPGAHGMVSGMSEQMLEMFGAFKKMSHENDVA